MKRRTKTFIVSVIIGFILSATVTCLVTKAYGQGLPEQDPKQITKVISNTVVTGVVQLSPEYKERVKRTKEKAPPNSKKEKRNKHAKTVIAKDSAIVNDTIMFEGQKYTLNEKTFKIRTRDKHDEKEFKGGAFVGGAYIMVTKVDKTTVHFVYRHSAFTKEVVFKKNLKGFKKLKKDVK